MQHHNPGDQNPKVYVVMVVSMNIMAFWDVMPVSSSDSLNISKGPITSIFPEYSSKTLLNNYLTT